MALFPRIPMSTSAPTTSPSLASSAAISIANSPHLNPSWSDCIHPDFWFKDGSIVVAVYEDQSTPKTHQRHLFRVHKSILCLQSPVFDTLFDFPPPVRTDTSMLFNGIPLVHLFDNIDEVVLLFEAMYTPGFFLLPDHDNATDTKLSKLLKIATKYDIQGLRNRIISHFLISWPNTFDDYVLSERAITSIKTRDHQNGLPSTLPDPVQAIIMGVDCHVEEILPSAYYDLIRQPWGTSSFPRQDAASLRTAKRQIVSSYSRRIDPTLLSPNELIQYARGRERIMKRVHELCRHPLTCSAMECHVAPVDDVPDVDDDGTLSYKMDTKEVGEDTACQRGVRQFWAKNVIPRLICQGPFDPLRILEELSGAGGVVECGACVGCERSVLRRIGTLRQEWWRLLAEDFGLKPRM